MITVWCKQCEETFQGEKTPELTCPQCGTPKQLFGGVSYELTSGRLWGTDAVPVYNEGLGEFTKGKKDMQRKAAAKGLRHREPGEPRRPSRKDPGFRNPNRKPLTSLSDI